MCNRNICSRRLGHVLQECGKYTTGLCTVLYRAVDNLLLGRCACSSGPLTTLYGTVDHVPSGSEPFATGPFATRTWAIFSRAWYHLLQGRRPISYQDVERVLQGRGLCPMCYKNVEHLFLGLRPVATGTWTIYYRNWPHFLQSHLRMC